MTCPSCGSLRVFPSRLRNVVERLRFRLTDKEPHRCRHCGWRGWRVPRFHSEGPDVVPDDLRTGGGAPPIASGDLDPLDPQDS
jgi:hypothetical protein